MKVEDYSPVKFSGTTLPGPACSLKDSTAHKENPTRGGPDSRDRSTAKSFRGVDSSITHRTTHRVAHKDNPEALIQGIAQTPKWLDKSFRFLETLFPVPPPKVNLKDLKLN